MVMVLGPPEPAHIVPCSWQERISTMGCKYVCFIAFYNFKLIDLLVDLGHCILPHFE